MYNAHDLFHDLFPVTYKYFPQPYALSWRFFACLCHLLRGKSGPITGAAVAVAACHESDEQSASTVGRAISEYWSFEL